MNITADSKSASIYSKAMKMRNNDLEIQKKNFFDQMLLFVGKSFYLFQPMWDKILHQGKTVLTPAAWQTFIYLNNPDVIRQKEEVF